MGGSPLWTRPSAPNRGDTPKAPAGDQRAIQGGDRPRRRLRGRYRLGHSQANEREGKVLRPPARALPSVIVDTENVLRGSGWAHEARGPEASNA